MYSYIEIKDWNDQGVVKRLDVKGKSDRSKETIESGMNRNLNHDEYFTDSFESEFELDEV